MRLAIISDLHLSLEDYYFTNLLMKDLEDVSPDVIINAGDSHTVWKPKEHTEFMATLQSIAPVVSCLGNHEFYRNSQIKPEDEQVIFSDIEGVRFISATLWTNFFNADPAEVYFSRRSMADFYYIPGWTVERQVAEFNRQRDKILSSVSDRTVVVTHHSPTRASVSPQFLSSDINGSFVNELDAEIKAHPGIIMWVHGHVHQDVDTFVGDRCRVVAHPRGYKGEENYVNYRPKVIDI